MNNATCQTCFTEFTKKSNSHKYCTPECGPGKHPKIKGECIVCGTPVERSHTGNRKSGFTCSQECKTLVRHPPKCDLPPNHPVLWIGKSSPWPKYGWKACAYCGTDYAATASNSKYCSPSCSWKQAERNKGVRPIAEIAAEVRQCARCGSDYQSPHVQRIHCSDLCRELSRKDRGVQVYHGWISQAERAMIYERDDYTCWLCNKECDITVDPQQHNDAPTLDHVVPRSKGGTHEYSNLRTACRRCNSIRSDSGAMTLEEVKAHA